MKDCSRFIGWFNPFEENQKTCLLYKLASGMGAADAIPNTTGCPTTEGGIVIYETGAVRYEGHNETAGGDETRHPLRRYPSIRSFRAYPRKVRSPRLQMPCANCISATLWPIGTKRNFPAAPTKRPAPPLQSIQSPRARLKRSGRQRGKAPSRSQLCQRPGSGLP